jgi:transposase-like protein
MGRQRRWGEEKWRELLAAFQRSGVSLKAFAEGVGVPYSTMTYWRQRERDDGRPRLLPVEVVAAAREDPPIIHLAPAYACDVCDICAGPRA